MERTYIMLKPNAYKKRIMGEIITRIEKKGFTITNMKLMLLSTEIVREHYAHIVNKPFYPEVEAFMTSGPVLAMIVEGEDVVQGMRNMMGPTKWLEAPAGTIRGDFATSNGENIIHGSDTPENAEIEIARFFGKAQKISMVGHNND